jgi:3-methyladenine DNA glycosylase AlkD
MQRSASEILKNLIRELARHDKSENKHNYQRFHKEKLKEPLGLKTAVLRRVSSQCFRELRSLPGREVLAICDDLLASGKRYMRFFAVDWATRVKDDYARSDFKRFEGWLKKYVNDWGACDHLCGGPIGQLLLRFPDLTVKRKPWFGSRNRWSRRAAAVSLIPPVRKRLLLDDVFATADALLLDSDDLVQKGYGWMLKEASNRFPNEVFAYVMKHKDEMPRTALRYAIEKYPPAKRKQAMKRG